MRVWLIWLCCLFPLLIVAAPDPYLGIIDKEKFHDFREKDWSIQAQLSPNIAYIRPNNFNDNKNMTALHDFLVSIKPGGRLIIDFRELSGGSLTVAQTFCDFFLKPNALCFILQKKETLLSYRAKKPILFSGPIYILVNEKTASTAEVLASSLRFHRQATIVGNQTYGKGSVQHVIPITASHYYKYTVGHLLSPSGIAHDKTGLAVEVMLGNLPAPQSKTADTHPLLLTDNSLQQVFELAKGARSR